VLTREYSITSIGILHKALKENFIKNTQGLLDRLIGIEAADIQEQLKLAADPEAASHKILWDRYTAAQRRILEVQVNQGIVPLLTKLFLSAEYMKSAVKQHIDELEVLKRQSLENTTDAASFAEALNAIRNFRRIPDSEPKAKEIVRQLGVKELKSRAGNRLAPFRFALFQRALLLVLRELMESQRDISLVSAGNILFELVRRALDKDVNLFAYGRHYLNHTIWETADIIVNRQSTRKQFARLLLAQLGAESFTRATIKTVAAGDSPETVFKRLVRLGEQQATLYLNAYAQDRESQFARTYETSLGLSDEQVDELRAAQQVEQGERERITEGALEASEATRPFKVLVRQHLRDEFATAEEQIIAALGYETHIVDFDVDEAVDTSEE
jgi:hypothetical protein